MCSESAKLDQLLLMLDELYASGHKVVIFSRFTRMLEIINKELIKKHFNIFYLDGGTRDRQSVVDNFENSVEGVFLISLKAGGVGLNLVSADTAIIYDPWWNPATEAQAIDRAYRIGQTSHVFACKVITKDTIEEKVLQMQQNKRKLAESILDHENKGLPPKFTLDDLNFLLS